MKQKKKIIKKCIAFLLILCMGSSSFPVISVQAEEKEEQSVSNEASEQVKKEKRAVANKASEQTETKEADSPAVSSETQSDTDAFQIDVDFAGQSLKIDDDNAITDTWSGNTSKVMKVQIQRKQDVKVDSGKQYILCMKTSDVFYFNGLPDISKITGAEEIAMIKNDTPTVYKSGGASGALDGFSNYSGEIRIRLNPAVQTITIPDVGISYNKTLIGYNGGVQNVTDPIQVKLISADSTASLGKVSTEETKVLHKVNITSVPVSSGSLTGNLKNAMSTDYFKNSILGQPVKLGKDGHISYYFGTNGQDWQVYKALTVVVSCPYVEVDGTKYYLDFNENDEALTDNIKKNAEKDDKKENINAKGYTMANKAQYDSSNHTITYTFKNIYLGSHTALLYTPDFTWPAELKDKIIDSDCPVKGVSCKITEQKGYLGNNATLKDSYTQPDTCLATFIPDQVNVTMVSSAESDGSAKIAKRFIYEGITRQNGTAGTLGFFDIHNEGSLDTPKLNIKYEFNTENKGATYYVTRVNLAAYREASTDVTYVLSDGKNEVSGTKKYDNSGVSFSCRIADLRLNSQVDDSYYIKSISYSTYLQKGAKYHAETAHLNRNREPDSGLFFGYLEGDLGTTASATMTISSADGKTAITEDGKTEISSNETSTVSDEDYIGMSVSSVNVSGEASQSISAGSSVTLNISGLINTEEYPYGGTINSNKVNGYHILRDGIFYVCLPEGVSIAGTAQVNVTSDEKAVAAEAPKQIGDSVDVDGVKAHWWAIPVNNLNTKGGKVVKASIQLSTSESMAGVVWKFANCVALRAKGQSVSWGAASSQTTVYNTVDELNKSGNAAIKGMADYLSSQQETKNLGIEFLNERGEARLNIARAEAKLNVTTALSTDESSTSGSTGTISKEGSDVNYAVTVACEEQGAAKDFNYYIPVVHTDSTIDSDALVSRKEIGLQLTRAVDITSEDGSELDSEQLPFQIFYTTDSDLDSTAIQGSSVTWTENCTDYSKVTAIRISTKDDASVKEGETYRFVVKMEYDNNKKDFEKQAGSIAAWRSFGRYTYTRNGATTTNSYPSTVNSVKIRYEKNLTGDPMIATLDTAASTSYVDVSQELPTVFVNKQKLIIKAVTPSNGTQLVPTQPTSLTGADANSKFKIAFNVNNSNSAFTLPNIGNGWTVDSNKNITLQARVDFSKALTDVTTDRYVDITLGNEDVNIICRVKLKRQVAQASADGSGVALGERFQVPGIETNCSISKDSAFTALYVVNNFVPGNYSRQLLKWQDGDGNSVKFPEGTSITMMEVDANSKVTSYWYCKPENSSVDLTSFKRMAGNDAYSYDKVTTRSTTLRYLFVVNFGQANADAGNYKLVLDAEEKTGAMAFVPVKLDVTLGNTKSYSVSTKVSEDEEKPKTTVEYNVAEATGNDSYSEGKTLSLVMKPTDQTTLPKDVHIIYNNKKYTCNSDGNIIIPLGTVQSETAELTLTSRMYPKKAQTYAFQTKLYLSNSSHAEAPVTGKKVASCNVEFKKSAEQQAQLKVTGTRVATVKDWTNGQPINIQMKDMNDATITVTAYAGLNDNRKITDLLSSVSGVFDMKDGTGTYNSGKTSDGKLYLSSTAKTGTYRLVFEVRNKNNETTLKLPYYIVVR